MINSHPVAFSTSVWQTHLVWSVKLIWPWFLHKIPICSTIYLLCLIYICIRFGSLRTCDLSVRLPNIFPWPKYFNCFCISGKDFQGFWAYSRSPEFNQMLFELIFVCESSPVFCWSFIVVCQCLGSRDCRYEYVERVLYETKTCELSVLVSTVNEINEFVEIIFHLNILLIKVPPSLTSATLAGSMCPSWGHPSAQETYLKEGKTCGCSGI